MNFFKEKNFFQENIINISTDEVYGNIEKEPSDENFPLLPNSPYSASKHPWILFLDRIITFNFPTLTLDAAIIMVLFNFLKNLYQQSF